VTLLCAGAALSLDVANQLIFFVDWPTCFRSWGLTTFIALFLSIPIARSIGAAHLALSKAIAAAESLSRTDQFTGLPNRRALIERVSNCGADILALVIVDIDWFKRVNDTHGHLMGDKVIQAIALSMMADLSALGMVARIGGEEFAVLAQGVSEHTVIRELDRFREKQSATPVIAGDVALRVTISAGIAIRTRDESFDSLFSEADSALYQAKRSGRNRVCVASEASPRELAAGDVRGEPVARAAEGRGDAAVNRHRSL
jgi:diguanylate cyclase (GGDEF)-like protein